MARSMTENGKQEVNGVMVRRLGLTERGMKASGIGIGRSMDRRLCRMERFTKAGFRSSNAVELGSSPRTARSIG